MSDRQALDALARKLRDFALRSLADIDPRPTGSDDAALVRAHIESHRAKWAQQRPSDSQTEREAAENFEHIVGQILETLIAGLWEQAKLEADNPPAHPRAPFLQVLNAIEMQCDLEVLKILWNEALVEWLSRESAYDGAGHRTTLALNAVQMFKGIHEAAERRINNLHQPPKQYFESQPKPQGTPAGWYIDPYREKDLRLWDGSDWGVAADRPPVRQPAVVAPRRAKGKVAPLLLLIVALGCFAVAVYFYNQENPDCGLLSVLQQECEFNSPLGQAP